MPLLEFWVLETLAQLLHIYACLKLLNKPNFRTGTLFTASVILQCLDCTLLRRTAAFLLVCWMSACCWPDWPGQLSSARYKARERERERGSRSTTLQVQCLMFDQHNSCFCKLNICSENTLCICIVRPSLYPLSSSASQHSLSESWPSSPRPPPREGSVLEVLRKQSC